jgi:adenylate cyclase
VLTLMVLGNCWAHLGDEGGTAVVAPLHQAMLSYLALQPGLREARDQLASLLWDDASEAQARQNLRQCLFRLRRDLGPQGADLLIVQGDAVALRAEAIRCDARDFARLSASASLEDREAAIALYRGPLLAGLRLDKEPFNEWLRKEQSRLEREAMALMHATLADLLAAGQGTRAVAVAERLAAIDPLNEEAQRALLRTLAAVRGREAALQEGEALRQRLRAELDCDPESATLELLEQVRADAVPPSLPLPPPLADMPSLAVLPFQNISGDPAHDVLAEGLCEELTSAFSRLRWLFVIARSSTLPFRRASRDIREAARQLGVRYVLEGSVRVAGQRMRVTCQLSDAEQGRALLTRKYDGAITDIFALQDEIAETVVAVLEPELYSAEERRAARRPPERLDAWQLTVTAIGNIHRFERRPNEQARVLLERATAIEPRQARARALLGWATLWARHCRWLPASEPDGLERARQQAMDAIAMDEDEPWGHAVHGFILSTLRQHEQGLAELRLALALNPSFALGHMLLGWALLRAGEHEQAIQQTARALRLSPMDRSAAVYKATHGLALLSAARFGEALPFLRASVTPFTEYMGHHNALISCCGHLGLLDEAAQLLAYRADRLGHDWRLQDAAQDLQGYAHAGIFLAGLARAGVPE